MTKDFAGLQILVCDLGFVVQNTADIFENQFPKIRKRHVTVTFGEPIKIKELEKEQKKFLGAYTQSIIEEMLKNS